MSFSADWLALREPADHRARNRDLLSDLARHFAARDTVRVVDLGCGTGSNLRAVAPVLPQRQEWRLVDHDSALLEAARERLAAWSDPAEKSASGLLVRRQDRTLAVSFERADLAADLDVPLRGPPDLVTAAALFDLVSPEWIGRLVAAVVVRRAAFYTALSYDGSEEWRPPHPADGAMRAAFHRHQGGDKGFGPAAGPAATAQLAALLAASGYRVRTAESAWLLGPDEAALVRALAAGAADAVRATGLVPEREIGDWLCARRNGATCRIGHLDCLALPP